MGRDRFEPTSSGDTTDGDGIDEHDYVEVGHSEHWEEVGGIRGWHWPISDELVPAAVELASQLGIPYTHEEIDRRRSLAGRQPSRRRVVGLENIVGIAIGHKVVGGEFKSEMAITVLVIDKVNPDQVESETLVPLEIKGVQTDVIETGGVSAMSGSKVQPSSRSGHRSMCGVSIRYYLPGESGTLGCVLRHGTRHYILSTNHTLSRLGQANKGDPIVRLSGGNSAIDTIAEYEDCVPLALGTKTLHDCDCAIAKTTLLSVDPKSVCFGKLPGSKSVVAGVGDVVVKCGATTSMTVGVVTSIIPLVRVDYDGSGRGFVWFQNQILVQPQNRRPFGFADGGDSGALVLTNSGHAPVGLLSAGYKNGMVAIVAPIDLVLHHLEKRMGGPVTILA
jgi:hypothetical protein